MPRPPCPHLSLLPFLALVFILPTSPVIAQCPPAQFGVLVKYCWSLNNDVAFPSSLNPVFTPLLCASHSSDYVMWQVDDFISDPARQLLQYNNNSALEAQLERSPAVLDFMAALEPTETTESANVTFQLDPSKNISRISCISKINPSPDWFVGLSNLDLCVNNSYPTESLSIVLNGWDGGIDAATTYEASDLTEDQAFVSLHLIQGPSSGYGVATVYRIGTGEPSTPPCSTPAPPQQSDDADSTICVDAAALTHFPPSALLYSTSNFAHVLCDHNNACATPGHIVIYNGRPMKMDTYCANTIVHCIPKVIKVNSPRYKRGLRIQTATPGLYFTAFAARYRTRAEEAAMAFAVRIGL